MIPLEEHPEIAAKYGVSFGWINLIQDKLKWLILIQEGINPVPNVVNDLFDDMTLGQMIATAKPRIKDEKLMGYLHDLNNKRRILAHGLGGEKAFTSKGKPPEYTGILTIQFKGKECLLDELLNEIIELAKKIGDIMDGRYVNSQKKD